jgi:hypothetical protein
MLLAVVPSSCIVLRTEVLHTETLGRCALAGPPSGGGGGGRHHGWQRVRIVELCTVRSIVDG